MWDPELYQRFGDERSRPFFDLVGRVAAEAPRVVVDLGCGPGPLTATLARRWPGAQVRGDRQLGRDDQGRAGAAAPQAGGSASRSVTSGTGNPAAGWT